MSKDYLDEISERISKFSLSDDFFKEAIKSTKKPKRDSYFINGKPSPVYSDFADFFDNSYPHSRKCIFRNVVFTRDVDKFKSWVPIENYRKVIESQCQQVGLSVSHTHRHLAEWGNAKKPEFLIDIPAWDGVDHLADALARIKVKNIPHHLFVELFKEWFSLAVQRMANPSIQNRLIVLRGRQGVGKDFAIRALTKGFGMYANEIDFNNNKTEIFRIVKNLGIGIVPEFDETHKSSISTIKSVITAHSIEMRALYENESQSIPIKTSFISASNFSNILRDTSGNRRFMIFDIDHIEHTFEQINSQQILAQAFSLAQEKYRGSEDAQKAMREIISFETPDDPEQVFIDEVRQVLLDMQDDLYNNKLASYRGEIEAGSDNLSDKLRWFQVSERIMRIAMRFGYKQSRVWQILKKVGFTKRDQKSAYYEA